MTQASNAPSHDEEVNLIDYFRALWKHKILLITVTVLLGIVSGSISYYLPRIYRVEMVVRPGVLSLNDMEEAVYIDSAENIKSLVEIGTFNQTLIEYLKQNTKDPSTADDLILQVVMPDETANIMVVNETPNIENGVIVLDKLKELLLKNYQDRVAYYRNEYDIQLSFKMEEIKRLEEIKQSRERVLAELELRNKQLRAEIDRASENVEQLLEQRRAKLSENSKTQELTDVLYQTTMQQNKELRAFLKNTLENNMLHSESEFRSILEINKEIRRLSEEATSIRYKRDNVQNVQVVQPPNSNGKPIRPRILLNTVLAMLIGAFLSIVSALFLESLRGVPEQ